MKVAAIIESYIPSVLAGSEQAAHNLFTHLAANGHEVRVHITQRPDDAYMVDGVRVVKEWGRWKPDLVYTHLYMCVPEANLWAESWGVPTVYWTHANTGVPGIFDVVIANTDVLAKDADLVLHPCSVSKKYKCARRGPRILRVGLSPQKGAHQFWDLTTRLPDHEFLGIVGSWGEQIVHVPGPNTMIMGPQRDMRSVYARSRILIMPSDEHETFGRTAIEACASGIPVIADPQPGLVEALGEAGIYASRYDLDCYESVIQCLDTPREYAYHANLCRRRAEYWDEKIAAELEAVEKLLVKVTRRRKVPA